METASRVPPYALIHANRRRPFFVVIPGRAALFAGGPGMTKEVIERRRCLRCRRTCSGITRDQVRNSVPRKGFFFALLFPSGAIGRTLDPP